MLNRPKSSPPTERRIAIAQPAVRSVPHLEWTGSDGPRKFKLDGRCVLGSGANCSLVLSDPAVSRVHAELEPRDGGVWIRDLNSRNGTFVEGVRVESALVGDGFTVRVGATEILVSYADAEQKLVESWPSDHFGPLFGKSEMMRELFASLSRLARLESSIMIMGETGTGKELVARAIHQASLRATGPFVVVDCASLSENLIEAELFGHTKGAYTGAHQSRAGAIETADRGTVFLDEIGELPIGMQPKLLRVLESSTVRRVGESTFRKVNVRFLAATHRDLLAMVRHGEFREDLYFRLAVLPVRVPSLRERTEDIELLLRHFSEGACEWLTPKILKTLESRPWRGNVRELRNYAERARAIGPLDALDFSDRPDSPGPDVLFDEPEPVTAVMPAFVPSGAPSSQRGPVSAAQSSPSPVSVSKGPESSADAPSEPDKAISERPVLSQPFRAFREQWIGHGERAFVRALLARHQNNVVAAAKEAGIDRTYLYRLMRKHSLGS